MSDEFTCSMCKETFCKGRSDEEAYAEAKQVFGNLAPEECVALCENCFNKLYPNNHPHAVEEAMAELKRSRMGG